MRSSFVVILVALASASGVAAGVAADQIAPASPLVRGLAIGGRVVADGAWPEQDLRARGDAAREAHLRLFVPGRSREPALGGDALADVKSVGDGAFDVTLADLGLSLDVQATLERAAAVGHTGSPVARVRAALDARRGRVDVPLVWQVDEAKARRVLAAIATAARRDATDARIDLDGHRKLAEVAGEEIDVDATLTRLLEAPLDVDDLAIPLAVRPLAPKVTLADLSKVDVGKLVASYETSYVLWGSGAGRAVNIHNAASKIDGTVLMPGETFSFNEHVGARTLERGFAMAPEIQADELQPGVGGGTCQVSSTLHAAALLATLEVVERQAHSMVSSYTKPGLDATVSYPDVDLKIRNTLSFPILIHARFPEPAAKETRAKLEHVRVEVLGGDPVAKVAYTYGVSHTEDFVRRIRVMPHLKPGQRIRHQHGAQGYEIHSLARIAYFDGRSEERRWFSGYRPVPEVYWVAPGYDAADMPPLPDHAKGVEVRAAHAVAGRDASSASSDVAEM